MLLKIPSRSGGLSRAACHKRASLTEDSFSVLKKWEFHSINIIVFILTRYIWEFSHSLWLNHHSSNVSCLLSGPIYFILVQSCRLHSVPENPVQASRNQWIKVMFLSKNGVPLYWREQVWCAVSVIPRFAAPAGRTAEVASSFRLSNSLKLFLMCTHLYTCSPFSLWIFFSRWLCIRPSTTWLLTAACKFCRFTSMNHLEKPGNLLVTLRHVLTFIMWYNVLGSRQIASFDVGSCAKLVY